MPSFPAGVDLLDDARVLELARMPDLIRTLETAFHEEADGDALTMERTRVIWDDGRLQAMGGYLRGRGCAAVKTWAITPGGGQPVVVLFSGEDGRIGCIVEAARLSQLRTGAASGVATDALALAGASTLALIGSGRQAFQQAAAVAAVRPLTRVLVAGRDFEKAGRFAADLSERLGIPAEAVREPAEAAAHAEIVTLITKATDPVIAASDLRPGTHVNGAGTILPTQCEMASDVFARADLVAVDSPTQAAEEAGDLRRALADGAVEQADLRPLCEVVAGRASRRSETDITVFKSVGVGLEDAAIAEHLWRAHREATAGADPETAESGIA